MESAEICVDVKNEGSGSPLPTVRAPDQEHGKGLTDLQDRFVDQFILLGGNASEAALAAGYASEVMGLRNLARSKVQEEIVRRLKLQAGSALAKAVGALFSVIENSSDHRAIVQAALGLMDRFGMAVPKGPMVAIQNNVVGSDMAQQIIAEVHAARSARLAA